MSVTKSKALRLMTTCLLLAGAALFSSCQLNPDDYELMTKDEIMTFINENSNGKFTFVSSKIENENTLNKSIEVKCKSNLTGDNIITVKHYYRYNEEKDEEEQFFESDYRAIYGVCKAKQDFYNLCDTASADFEFQEFYRPSDERFMSSLSRWSKSEETGSWNFTDGLAGRYVIVIKHDVPGDSKEDSKLRNFCSQLFNIYQTGGIILFDKDKDLDPLTEETVFDPSFLTGYKEGTDYFEYRLKGKKM